jgi:hypothetical protein
VTARSGGSEWLQIKTGPPAFVLHGAATSRVSLVHLEY